MTLFDPPFYDFFLVFEKTTYRTKQFMSKNEKKEKRHIKKGKLSTKKTEPGFSDSVFILFH